jgi:hypothetical protein
MVVIAGGKSEQIRGKKRVEERMKNENVDEELGLEFIR